MSTYYVFIPGGPFSAEVRDAPDSRHARTAVLDYLSRNHQIDWDQRSVFRSQLRTTPVEPGEFPTQVQLDYNLQGPSDIPEDRLGFPEEEGFREDQGFQGVDPYEEDYEEVEDPIDGSYREIVPDAEPVNIFGGTEPADIFGDSPIIRLSRKSGGM